jgi:hypothetical protein
MTDLDAIRDLPLTVHLAVIFLSLCFGILLAMLVFAPRRNCFFFRWRPETRFLALLFSPALLILWPIVLYAMFLKSRGIEPNDLDFFEDD